MLIDTLLQSDVIDNVDPRREAELRQRLRSAVKFELASDFAAAAEALAIDLVAIEKALPYCRLPYPSTWIEVAQQHRPRFRAAVIHLPEIQSVPHRVGFLLRATSSDLSTFNAYQFWELKNFMGRPQASHMAMHYDPKAMLDFPEAELGDAPGGRYLLGDVGSSPEWLSAPKHIRQKLASTVQPGRPDYAEPVFDVVAARSDLGARLMYEVGAVDWSGEGIYLLGVLALLNTINATEIQQAPDLSGINRVRARKKKPPLAEVGVVRIHPRIRRHIVGNADAHGHRELTRHMVRGHWKVRKTGIFFWRPYVRGEGPGPKPKTYMVE